MKLRIAELRQAANALFDHIERSGIDEIEVDQDYYWSIPDEKLHAIYEEPTGFTAGQLSDDLQELRRMNSGERPPMAYALVWLSSLLRFAGTRIVS